MMALVIIVGLCFVAGSPAGSPASSPASSPAGVAYATPATSEIPASPLLALPAPKPTSTARSPSAP